MIAFLDSDLRDIIAHSPFSRRDVVRFPGTANSASIPAIWNGPLRENPGYSGIGTTPKPPTVSTDVSVTFACQGEPPARGERLLVGDREYEAYKTLHDGHGMVTVFLHERETVNVDSAP
jgi:hypothetical protein